MQLAGSHAFRRIHYADYQAAIQSFGDFPTASGHTATIASNSSAAPNEFAFIPNNASSTYIIDAKVRSIPLPEGS